MHLPIYDSSNKISYWRIRFYIKIIQSKQNSYFNKLSTIWCFIDMFLLRMTLALILFCIFPFEHPFRFRRHFTFISSSVCLARLTAVIRLYEKRSPGSGISLKYLQQSLSPSDPPYIIHLTWWWKNRRFFLDIFTCISQILFTWTILAFFLFHRQITFQCYCYY